MCELKLTEEDCQQVQGLIESLVGRPVGGCFCNDGKLLAQLIVKFPRRVEVIKILSLTNRADHAAKMLHAHEPPVSVPLCSVSSVPITQVCTDKGCPAWIPQEGLMCCAQYASGFYGDKVDNQALRSMFLLPEKVLTEAVERVRDKARSVFQTS